MDAGTDTLAEHDGPAIQGAEEQTSEHRDGNQQVTKQMARFAVMCDTPSDIEVFERHYREVHVPLAKQLPGPRRYTVSHDATPVIGEPYYLVAMLDWDDLESQGAALDSEAGNKTAEDVITNLSRYTTIRGMIVQLDDK